jgi:hypothetical protein
MGGPGSGKKPRDYPPDIVELVCGMYRDGMTVAEIRRIAPKGYRVQTILERYLPSRRPLGKRDQIGEKNASWAGDRLGYEAAHARVKRLHGPARSHPCVDCGEQARDWSYRGGCPRELTCPDTGCRYSPDPERYEPRCVPCHRRYDAQMRNEEVMSNV